MADNNLTPIIAIAGLGLAALFLFRQPPAQSEPVPIGPMGSGAGGGIGFPFSLGSIWGAGPSGDNGYPVNWWDVSRDLYARHPLDWPVDPAVTGDAGIGVYPVPAIAQVPETVASIEVGSNAANVLDQDPVQIEEAPSYANGATAVPVPTRRDDPIGVSAVQGVRSLGLGESAVRSLTAPSVVPGAAPDPRTRPDIQRVIQRMAGF